MRLIQSDLTQSQGISRFYGLNRLEKGRSGEFKDMYGLSSDRYPCMSAAKTALKLCDAPEDTGHIYAVIAPKYNDRIEGVTGVCGTVRLQANEFFDLTPIEKTYFYYNGKEIPFEDPDNMYLSRRDDFTLVDFNGRIIICAYDESDKDEPCRMYYYDYTATGTDAVKNMETTVTGTMTAYGSGDPDKDVTVINYITLPTEAHLALFKAGDAVQISGFNNTVNNTLEIDSKFDTADRTRPISAIVEKTEITTGTKPEYRLYLQLYNYLRERLVFQKTNDDKDDECTKIKIGIPTMNHICIHNNRLWGTNPNGEYVYASKLGDPFNWNTFQGLSNDSYYAEIGTAGDFVGIVSYRDNLVAFKRDYIHHIYGDKPSNYSIPKQLSDCGCIDIKSAVQIGTGLYFLGYNGFYIYQGGQPELISDKLDKTYDYATAATDGQKYIVSCEDGLLVYDTRYNVWHREQEIDTVKGYFRRGNKVYIATDTTLYEYGGKDAEKWEAETIIMTEGMFENKGLISIWIRAILDEGSYIDVRTAEDGGDWVGSFRMDKAGLNRYEIPVRQIDGDYYAIKFIGHGNAVITDIEKVYVAGGRDYRQNEVR